MTAQGKLAQRATPWVGESSKLICTLKACGSAPDGAGLVPHITLVEVDLVGDEELPELVLK